MQLGDLTIESAKSLVGTTFEVRLSDGSHTTMKVIEAIPYDVRPGRRQARQPRRTPFSIYFLGDPAIVLPQGMYAFSSPDATFENLFIVPIGRDDQGTEYEAVFT